MVSSPRCPPAPEMMIAPVGGGDRLRGAAEAGRAAEAPSAASAKVKVRRSTELRWGMGRACLEDSRAREYTASPSGRVARRAELPRQAELPARAVVRCRRASCASIHLRTRRASATRVYLP